MIKCDHPMASNATILATTEITTTTTETTTTTITTTAKAGSGDHNFTTVYELRTPPPMNHRQKNKAGLTHASSVPSLRRPTSAFNSSVLSLRKPTSSLQIYNANTVNRRDVKGCVNYTTMAVSSSTRTLRCGWGQHSLLNSLFRINNGTKRSE